MKLKQKTTAYHEAGHFVAALFLGVPVKYVTIIPDSDSGGHCKCGFGYREGQLYEMSAATVIKFEKSMMVSLAGYEAQRKFRPSSGRSHHGAGDRKNVAEFVFRMTAPNEASLLIKLLTVRTRNLLAVRWNEVEKIAAALLERKWLSLEDGQRIIFGDEFVDTVKGMAERTKTVRG
jgi:hypothetical protein